MAFLSIVHEQLPCQYELSWDADNKQIVLRIWRDLIAQMEILSSRSPFIKVLKDQLGFETFSGQYDRDFGFDRALKYLGEKDGFVAFAAPLCSVEIETEKTCHWCHGSKIDPITGETCIPCGGTGREIRIVHEQVMAMSASLMLLLGYLIPADLKNVGSPKAHLMDINLHVSCDDGRSRAGINGNFSKSLVAWLRKQPESRDFDELVEVMRQADEAMFLRHKSSQWNFRVHFRSSDGGLTLCCPGDACSTIVEWREPRDEGYHFYDHNVDQCFQLLTLLAGLAGLHDLARAAGI